MPVIEPQFLGLSSPWPSHYSDYKDFSSYAKRQFYPTWKYTHSLIQSPNLRPHYGSPSSSNIAPLKVNENNASYFNIFIECIVCFVEYLRLVYEFQSWTWIVIRGDQQYSQIRLGMEIHGTKLYSKNALPYDRVWNVSAVLLEGLTLWSPTTHIGVVPHRWTLNVAFYIFIQQI